MTLIFSGQMGVSGNVGLTKTGPDTLFSAIQSEGLTTGLQLALDAGDSNSYSGSGQKWLDTSGNGYDFYRGATSSPDADDPTFNGSAGGVSDEEYWSSDGDDFFNYDSANETWMNNLHKNNAQWSFLAAVYIDTITGGSLHGLFGTNGGAASANGLYWLINGTGKQSTFVSQPGSPPAVLNPTSDNAVSTDAWHILGWTVDESVGAGGGFFYKDGAYDQVSSSDTFNSTYLNPSAASATHTLDIGALGNGSNRLKSGDRMAFFAAWEGTVLTKENYDSLFASLGPRFGL